jgi:hypothetical protein
MAKSAQAEATPQAEAETVGAVEVGQEIVRKISPKAVLEKDLNKMIVGQEVKLPCDLYTLIGRTGNLRDGMSDFGTWTALIGEFEAQRLYDGSMKKFISSQAFIPGAAGDLLVAQVRKFVQEPIEVTPEQFKKSGRTYKVTGEFVELAVIVGAKESSRAGGQPYEFTIRPIVKVQQADSLASLRDKMQLALPSPTK